MTAEWSVPAWALLLVLAVVAALLVVLAVLVRRATTRAERAEHLARTEAEALRAQVHAIERQVAGVGAARRTRAADAAREPDYVITRLGTDDVDDVADEAGTEPAPTVDAPLFADLVLRESVVQAASLAAGLRRALAPSQLHRIRYEMRREVKRARKQRRSDLRQARRSHGSHGASDREAAA